MGDRSRAKSGMRKCPVCGREFWCCDLEKWAYRTQKSGRDGGTQICSWRCQVEYNREAERTHREWFRREMAAAERAENIARKKEERKCRKRKKIKEIPESVWYWLGGLKKVMEEQGVTQSALAQCLGVSRSAIQAYMTRRQRCPRNTAVAIAGALTVDLDEITTGEPVYNVRQKKTPGEEGTGRHVKDGNAEENSDNGIIP